MNETYDLIIIGGGPAGLTAAIYASRANLSTLIIESAVSGGKLHKTHEIENYPAVSKVIGSELAEQFVAHSQEFGAKIVTGEVTKIETLSGIHIVTTDDGNARYAKAVIIATGTKERLLKIPGALEHIGNGVSYCAVCDGFFYRKKPIVVIGAGNSGMEESLFLKDICSHITIIEMADEPLAEATIVDACNKADNIDLICHHTADSLVLEDDKVVGLVIKDTHTGETKTIECAGVFPYMGADPCTSFVDPSLLNERGYIKVKADMSTDVPGIYAAGDCIDKGLRQVITACSDGAIAANSVAKYLKK